MLRICGFGPKCYHIIFLIVVLFIQVGVVQAPEYDNAIVSTVDAYLDTSHPLRMGIRQTFFAVNRSWLFYMESGSYWYYTSSADGETWATPTIYAQLGTYQIAFRYDEARNLLHIARCTAVGTIGLKYQQATPYANGTLDLDILQTVTLSYWVEQLHVNVDSNGYAYIAYGNTTSSGQPYFTKNSDNTTGGWSTDAGFPLALNSTGTWTTHIQLGILDNDFVHAVYYQKVTPPTTPLFSRLYCANNGTLNAQVNASYGSVGAGGQTVAYSLAVRGNDTYIYYLKYGVGDVAERLLTFYNYTTLSWDYMNEILFGGNFGGEICYDSANDRIYFLGMESADDSAIDIIYWNPPNSTANYQENIEESITLNKQYWACTPTVDEYGRMGVAWCQTNYPPYVLRYAWLSYPYVPPTPPPDEKEPLPDLVSMYMHLALMLLGLLMMFFAVIWLALAIKKKGINEVTIERGGYSMLTFFIGFALLMSQLYAGGA